MGICQLPHGYQGPSFYGPKHNNIHHLQKRFPGRDSKQSLLQISHRLHSLVRERVLQELARLEHEKDKSKSVNNRK